MYIAVTMGTLLLGGWVLDSSTDDNQATAPTQAQQPAGGMPMQPRGPALMDRGQGQSMPGTGGDQTRGRPMRGGQGAVMRRTMGGIPNAPTDSMSGGALGQPTAPTSNAPPTDMSQMNMGPGQSMRAYTPSAPTERRSTSSQSAFRPTSRSQLGQQTSGMPQMTGNVANMLPPSNYTTNQSSNASTDKAFSGYRAPSGVSPYLNLFRRSGEAVDNYSTLVRPELDQRFLNHQLGGQIRGLQRDTRAQGTNLQQLNQNARTLQGVATPQFYQNTGGYYPMQGQ